MNCEEFIRQLDLLMDDALDEAQRRELNEHAHTCPNCAAELRSTLQLKAMLKSLPVEADVPLAAQAGWRRAVRTESKRAGARRRRRMAAAAAAVVVAVVGVRLAVPRANDAASVAPKTASHEEAAYEEASLKNAEMPAEEALYEASESAMGAAYDSDIVLADEVSLAVDGAEEEAVTAGGVAELYSVSIRVEDVQAAGEGILDAAREYDADAALTETEDGAQVEAALSAADARELLEAVRQWDEEPDSVALPEVGGEDAVVLVHIQAR